MLEIFQEFKTRIIQSPKFASIKCYCIVVYLLTVISQLQKIGITMDQEIMEHVCMFRPFLRIPRPKTAFSDLLALVEHSSIPQALSWKMWALMPTCSYSMRSATFDRPSLKIRSRALRL